MNDAMHPSNASLVRTMLRHLDSAFVHHLPVYSSREVSTTIWAWGRLAHKPSDEIWVPVREALVKQPTRPHRGDGRLQPSSSTSGSVSIPSDNESPTWGLGADWTEDRRDYDARHQSSMLSSATPQVCCFSMILQYDYCRVIGIW